MKTLHFSLLIILVVGVTTVVSAQAKGNRKKSRMRMDHYEQIDFEGLMHRYLSKPVVSSQSIEGIYSVSCIVTKRGKGFLSGNEKEKTVERKDNYARVAIIKDVPGTGKEYIEISLDERFQVDYPVVGEFNGLSEGNGFIYNHTEPDGKSVSFTFTNEQSDILDGMLAEMKGRKTITYKMTYLKVFPKNGEPITSNR